MNNGNTVKRSIFTVDINDTDLVKIIVIASFILLSILLTVFVYGNYSQNIDGSFLFLMPQLFYIPIILLSVWYPKKSLQATILMIAAFLAVVTYYYFAGIKIDPFVAGLNAAIYLWVVVATTHFAHKSGLINLKYLNFFRNANAGLLIVDLKTNRIIDINDKITGIFEYEQNEIVGITTDELSKNLFGKNSPDKLISGSPDGIKDVKAKVIKKSGLTATVLISCRKNPAEDTLEYTIVDITKQENESASANKDIKKLLDFIGSTHDLMFVLDKKGSIQKLHFENDSVEKKYFKNFIGRSFSELIEKPDISEYRSVIREVIENGKTIPFDAEIKIKDNKRHVLIIFGPLNDSSGNTTGVIGNLHERTNNRTRSTKELVDEFESKRWNNFVNTAAHELRTPLQPVLGYLHLLIDEPEESGINESTVKILKKCLVSVERECSIVERMLETGIINSYNIRLLLSDISLNDMIDDLISIGGYSKNTDISVNIPKNTKIRADPDRIYQVFEGIVSNAVKYNAEPRIIEIAYNSDDNNHYISFKDNGTGIPKDSVNNIFEPFFISNIEKLSREYGRIGLGLSIAKRYVIVHGGDIAVESVLGKGSTFTVILPKKPDDIVVKTNPC